MLLRTMSLLTERSFVYISLKMHPKKGTPPNVPFYFSAIPFHAFRHANIV